MCWSRQQLTKPFLVLLAPGRRQLPHSEKICAMVLASYNSLSLQNYQGNAGLFGWSGGRIVIGKDAQSLFHTIDLKRNIEEILEILLPIFVKVSGWFWQILIPFFCWIVHCIACNNWWRKLVELSEDVSKLQPSSIKIILLGTTSLGSAVFVFSLFSAQPGSAFYDPTNHTLYVYVLSIRNSVSFWQMLLFTLPKHK